MNISKNYILEENLYLII